MMDENSASSSEYDVSIRHLTWGVSDWTSRQTSMPLPSGRRTSRMATSGTRSRMDSRPCSAVPASPTTSMSSSASSSVRRPVRTSS